MAKPRIIFIDILKLFTIYLVIWGHAIMNFQPDYELSYIFRSIYAFHMPLFMMLSGYFATSSMSLTINEFFIKKIRQLLLPCISWGIICWLVIRSGLIRGEFNLRLSELFTGWLGIIDNFWFLKSCFICYTLTWLCYRCGKYKLIMMGIVWILCTMQGRFHLDMMFPSFLAGVYLRKSDFLRGILVKDRYVLYMVFLSLLCIYLFTNIPNIYFFRLALGISGAMACFILFNTTIGKHPINPKLEMLASWGEITLGVYILQAILLEVLMPQYISFASLPMSAIVILMPLLSLATLGVLLLIVNNLNRLSFLGFLLFGR